jgi:hypothetical protein
MVILPFTRKARARDVAVEELRPLLTMEQLPRNFWEQPYAVAFILGYIEGVVIEATEERNYVNFLVDVTTAVLAQLTSVQQVIPIVTRAKHWQRQRDPQFAEGKTNGKFIALFMHGDRKADATELAAEAFRQARERAPVFDRLREPTNERGRAAMILCDALFFDKVSDWPAKRQRDTELLKQAARENTARERQEIERRPKASSADIERRAREFTVNNLERVGTFEAHRHRLLHRALRSRSECPVMVAISASEHPAKASRVAALNVVVLP